MFRLLMVALLACWALVVQAETPQLKGDAPQHYTVVKGDTLWHITGRFFSNPWLWPQLWAKNPQIANPHLIYPGDQIHLVKVNGQPRLVLKRGDSNAKLLAQTKVSELIPVPTLPLSTIGPFLRDSLIDDPSTFLQAPYVVGSESKKLLSGPGDLIYVRGPLPYKEREWRLYRPARMLKQELAEDKEVVYGQEGMYIATLRLEQEAEQGDIHAFRVLKVRQEISAGDRLLSVDESPYPASFEPGYPSDRYLEGLILAVPEGVAYSGRFDIQILNLGELDGLRAGHILEVRNQGQKVKDPVTNEVLQMPDSRAGMLMVFKTFDRTSYALVLKAEKTIRVGDKVVVPQS